MHVIPPNGFPNVPSFADLDAIAKKIENIPTFTSDDRAFLSDLPSYPSEDGTKVLTATTTSGETSLSYEEVENELPTNPSEDGTKVLTATTTSGETVLSWGDIITINYSTTEQKTGQKWIDGKDIYFKTIVLENVLSLPTSDTWVDSNIDTTDVDYIISANVRDCNGVNFAVNVAKQLGDVKHLAIMHFRNAQIGVQIITLFYTKITT